MSDDEGYAPAAQMLICFIFPACVQKNTDADDRCQRAEISLIFRESAQTELLFPTAFFAGRGPREPKHSRATKISLAQSGKYGRDRHAQETARYVRNTAAAQSSLSSALTPHDCGDGAARRGP